MKTILKHSLLLIAILTFSLGCKKVLKDPLDYYPEVKMVNATIQPDGTVLVEGEVISPGKYKTSKIESVGFCASSTGEPEMLDKQIVANLNGNKFSAIYPVGYFDENAAYHIAAWGTNDFGYAKSEALSFDSLFLNVDPPCSLNDMYYYCAGNTGYYDDVVTSNPTYFIAMHGNNRFYIEFPSTVHAGIYTTYSYPYSTDRVRCTVQIGNQYPVSNGETVYVEKINATSYRVTVCGANVPIGAGSSTYTGSFIIEP